MKDYDTQQRDGFMTGAPNLGVRPQRMDMWHIRGPLTDKQIDDYSRAGWYSSDAKQARKARAERKLKREGNFLEIDGRKVYCPQ
jgi:hypothetical protein